MASRNNSSNFNNKAGPWVDEDRVKTMQTPLPPIDEYDTRPAVRELIQKHRTNIDQMRARLERLQPKLYNPIRHDDLWMLRYYLSQKTIAKAVTAASDFLEFRHEHHLDETDIRADPPGPDCSHPHVSKFFQCLDDDGMILTAPDPNRGTVIFMRMRGIHQSKLQEQISVDEWPLWYLLEWQFQMIDSVTRRTGRLTKAVRVLDFSEYSLSQNHRPFMSRCSEWGKATQDQYPQSLGAVYMVNAPALVVGAFSILKNLIPKRFVEKFAVLNMKSCSDQQLLYKYITKEYLPIKYRGSFATWPYPRHCDPTRSIVDRMTIRLTNSAFNKRIANGDDEIKKTNTDSTANSSSIIGHQEEYDSHYSSFTTTQQKFSSFICGEMTCCYYVAD